MPFEDYWDFKLQKWVRGPGERDRIARDQNLININDWENPEDIMEVAEKNRKENMHKTYDGYDEAVARALYRAEHGYEFEHTLADDIRYADSKNQYKRVPLPGEEDNGR